MPPVPLVPAAEAANGTTGFAALLASLVAADDAAQPEAIADAPVAPAPLPTPLALPEASGAEAAGDAFTRVSEHAEDAPAPAGTEAVTVGAVLASPWAPPSVAHPRMTPAPVGRQGIEPSDATPAAAAAVSASQLPSASPAPPTSTEGRTGEDAAAPATPDATPPAPRIAAPSIVPTAARMPQAGIASAATPNPSLTTGAQGTEPGEAAADPAAPLAAPSSPPVPSPAAPLLPRPQTALAGEAATAPRVAARPAGQTQLAPSTTTPEGAHAALPDSQPAAADPAATEPTGAEATAAAASPAEPQRVPAAPAAPPAEGTAALPEMGAATGAVSPSLPAAPAPEAAPAARGAAPVPWPARQVAPFAVALALGPDASISLTLEPGELGRVEVAIERTGAEAHVSLRAERPETLALLLRDRAELERALADAGLGRGDAGGPSLSFGLGGDADARRDQRSGPGSFAPRGKPPAEPQERPPPLRAAGPRSLIDLAV